MDDRVGWTFDEIANQWPSVDRSILSQAIDYLCDRSYLVPWYPSDLGADGSYGRYYRTSEDNKIGEKFDWGTQFLGFIARQARKSIPEMVDGVRFTFFNKLVYNVLVDLEQQFSQEDWAKLEAVAHWPGPYGPEVGLREQLRTGVHTLGIFELPIAGFQITEYPEPEPGARGLVKGLVEPGSTPETLEFLSPANARLVESLTSIYISAYQGLGRNVSSTLLPLALYRHRDAAFRFLYYDLKLWVRNFANAISRWGHDDERDRRLADAGKAIDAYRGKRRARDSFRKKRTAFLRLATAESPSVGNWLKRNMEAAASDSARLSNIDAVATAFKSVQDVAATLANASEVSQTLAYSLERALEQVGYDKPPLPHPEPEAPAGWLESALAVCMELFDSVPKAF